MNQKYLKWGAGVVAVGAAAMLLEAVFLEKYFFEVKTFEIGDLSKRKKVKLVLITDLHLRHFVFPYQRKLAAKINQLAPDLLLIAGDTLDSHGEAATADKFLGLLDHGIQKVAIPGNHDYKAKDGLAKLRQVYAQHHCRLLMNESWPFTLAGTRVMVTGLDDLLEGDSNFRKAVTGIGREEHHLLLVHSPLQQENAREVMEDINQHREPAERLNIRYIFAGHNHGGQVKLPGYVPVLPKKSGGYVQGWYNQSAPFLYLSRGFGTSSLPVRFFSRSEVTVFNYFV